MAIEKPAIEGGTPVRSQTLPYATQWISDDDIDAVVDTLKSGWLTGGPKIGEFEREFAAYVGAPHAIALNSCTSALNLSVIALGIGPGDEVITTPMTFVATTLAIIHAGATPVFTDIEENTLNMDAADIERRITPRTKAIMPMHYGGNPVDLDAVLKIAGEHGLKVIEDAAHAAGAEYRGRKIGTHGDLVNFSFHAIKNATCAEGGAITSADPELAEKLKTLRYFGIPQDAYKRASSPTPWKYEVVALGYKYNTTDIQCALGLSQLKRLDEFNAIRKKYVDMYNEAFRDVAEIETPGTTPGARPSHHIYVIRLREGALRVDRDRILAALRAENIFANVHYTPVYRHPYFAETMKLDPADYPVCERVARCIVTLPLFPKMTVSDLESVVAAVKKVLRYYRKQ